MPRTPRTSPRRRRLLCSADLALEITQSFRSELGNQRNSRCGNLWHSSTLSILPSHLFRAQLTSWWPRLTTVWCKEALPGWNSSLLLSRFRPVSQAWPDNDNDDMICNFRQQFCFSYIFSFHFMFIGMANDYYFDYFEMNDFNF